MVHSAAVPGSCILLLSTSLGNLHSKNAVSLNREQHIWQVCPKNKSPGMLLYEQVHPGWAGVLCNDHAAGLDPVLAFAHCANFGCLCSDLLFAVIDHIIKARAPTTRPTYTRESSLFVK